jgi:hypothetical protein
MMQLWTQPQRQRSDRHTACEHCLPPQHPSHRLPSPIITPSYHLQKDIIFYDNDADFVILDPDWDSLLEGLRQRLPRSYRVFYVVPSEDRSIKWIRVMTGVGIMDLVSTISCSSLLGL